MRNIRSNKNIRLFISSTFSDMKIERKALHEVFNGVKDYCRSKGWQFEAVDLRWGIKSEAGHEQKTMGICLNEIARCQNDSPRPNFLILLGERYGWIPLPEKLLYNEVYEILSLFQENEKKLFFEWYKLDNNALPSGEFILQPRYSIYLDYDFYLNEVEIPLNRVFFKYSDCLSEEKRRKFNRSATEQEIYNGALSVEDANEHVIACIRTLYNIPIDKKNIFSDNNSEIENSKIKDLRKDVLEKIDNSNIVEFDIEHDYYLSNNFIEDFKQRIYNKIITIIDNEIDHYSTMDHIQEELSLIDRFMEDRREFFIGRENEIRTILLCFQSNSNHSIMITGVSGCGKSTFLAETINQIRSIADVDIICRYIGVTGDSFSGEKIIKSIWDELNTLYDNSENLSCSYRNFAYRLERMSPIKPLVIVIDGLDQLQINDSFLDLSWIPLLDNNKVFIIFSVLDRKDYNFIKERQRNALTIQLHPFSEDEAYSYVFNYLGRKNRSLSNIQKDFVKNTIIKSDKTPIYLKLLTEFIIEWHSYDSDLYLPDNTEALIRYKFDELARPANYGTRFVNLVLSLLCSVRFGLSHEEIRELLASDDQYWSELINSTSHEINCDGNRIIPSAIWSRFYNDFSSFLSSISLENNQLITFFHRQIREVANKYYLTNDTKSEVSGLLSDYFDKKWRSGDVHALFELPYILKQAGSIPLLKDLFENFDFIIQKGANKLTLKLLNDYNYILDYYYADPKNNAENINDILDIIDFEQNIEYSKVELTRNRLLRKAANYSPDNIIRKLFNKYSNYNSLNNTLGFTGKKDKCEFFIPIEVDYSNTTISDNGEKIASINKGEFFIYNFQNGFISNPVYGYNIDKFSISSDFNTIAFLSKKELFYFNNEISLCNKISDGFAISDFILTSQNKIVFITEDGHDLYCYNIKDTTSDSLALGEECRLAFSSQDASVVILQTSDDNIIRIKDKDVDEFSFYNKSYELLNLSDDGSKLFILEEKTIDYDLVIVYETSSFENINSYEIRLDPNVGAVNYRGRYAISNNGIIAVGLYNNTHIIDSNTNDIYTFEDTHIFCASRDGGITEVIISADGKKLISFGIDRYLVIYNLQNKKIQNKVCITNHVDFYPVPLANKTVNTVLLEYGVLSPSFDNYSIYRQEVWNLNNLDNHWYIIDGLAIDSSGDTICLINGSFIAQDTDDRCLVVNCQKNSFRKNYIYPLQYNVYEKHFSRKIFASALDITPDGGTIIFTVGDTTFLSYDGKTVSKSFTPCTIKYSVVKFTKDRNCFYGFTGDRFHGVVHSKGELWDIKDNICINKYHGFDLFGIEYDLINFPNGRLSLLNSFQDCILDLEANEIISNIEDINLENTVIFPDGKTVAFHNEEKLQSYLYRIEGKKLLPCNFRIIAVSNSGNTICTLDGEVQKITIYKFNDIIAEINIEEKLKACIFCYDDIHLFICSENIIILYNLEIKEEIQSFYINSFDRRLAKLFNNGICVGGRNEIYKLEPSNGYKINQTVIVTIARVWNFREHTYMQPSAECPMCGNFFHPSTLLVDFIEDIHVSLDNYESPYLNSNMWEHPELKGTCPYCNVKLKFNPYIA